ncbi:MULTISPECIES: hypothetical protein [Saccharothrix]|uniref:hypothetical protein n=1 Tax=Saccharothrix TaxID=2071 RepID=UPI00093A052C|nr:hypothetical protein [Saccharothrix sp. CB00851]OKI37962.1 hypothetical protein A6A25_17705 [Saccharothrix sp. CB00851]
MLDNEELARSSVVANNTMNRERRLTGSNGYGRYLGADDRAGPNYTGQPAVHSYYADASAKQG